MHLGEKESISALVEVEIWKDAARLEHGRGLQAAIEGARRPLWGKITLCCVLKLKATIYLYWKLWKTHYCAISIRRKKKKTGHARLRPRMRRLFPYLTRIRFRFSSQTLSSMDLSSNKTVFEKSRIQDFLCWLPRLWCGRCTCFQRWGHLGCYKGQKVLRGPEIEWYVVGTVKKLFVIMSASFSFSSRSTSNRPSSNFLQITTMSKESSLLSPIDSLTKEKALWFQQKRRRQLRTFLPSSVLLSSSSPYPVKLQASPLPFKSPSSISSRDQVHRQPGKGDRNRQRSSWRCQPSWKGSACFWDLGNFQFCQSSCKVERFWSWY